MIRCFFRILAILPGSTAFNRYVVAGNHWPGKGQGRLPAGSGRPASFAVFFRRGPEQGDDEEETAEQEQQTCHKQQRGLAEPSFGNKEQGAGEKKNPAEKLHSFGSVHATLHDTPTPCPPPQPETPGKTDSAKRRSFGSTLH